jgi:hypothetical protein
LSVLIVSAFYKERVESQLLDLEELSFIIKAIGQDISDRLKINDGIEEPSIGLIT